MANLVLAVHERIGNWAQHLRPRLAGVPVRLTETRSGGDLEQALHGAVCPLLVLDVAQRPGPMLDDLQRALTIAPDALTLVLNPHSLDGVALIAREVGATLVLDGPTPPPAVADWLARWVRLARRRSEADGPPLVPPSPTADPWAWLNPYLGGRPLDEWPAGR